MGGFGEGGLAGSVVLSLARTARDESKASRLFAPLPAVGAGNLTSGLSGSLPAVVGSGFVGGAVGSLASLTRGARKRTGWAGLGATTGGFGFVAEASCSTGFVPACGGRVAFPGARGWGLAQPRTESEITTGSKMLNTLAHSTPPADRPWFTTSRLVAIKSALARMSIIVARVSSRPARPRFHPQPPHRRAGLQQQGAGQPQPRRQG